MFVSLCLLINGQVCLLHLAAALLQGVLQARVLPTALLALFYLGAQLPLKLVQFSFVVLLALLQVAGH